jgi:excisionase family DNA binding protein
MAVGIAAPMADHQETADVFERLAAVESKIDEVLVTLRQKSKPFLTSKEVAEVVGRSEDTVRRWIREKRLPAERIAGTGPRGRLLVSREALTKLISAGLASGLNATELS